MASRWNTSYMSDVRNELVRTVDAQSTSKVVTSTTSRKGSQTDRGRFFTRPVLTTVVVGAFVIAGAVVVIQTVAPASHGPAAAPTSSSDASRSALKSAVAGILPAGAADQPALSWTDRSPGATGGPLDMAGKVPTLAAACSGGGSIKIEVTGRPSINLDCSSLSTSGPTSIADASGGGIGVTVVPVTGTPEYLVDVLALSGN